MVGLHRDLARQRSRAENFEAVTHFIDDAELDQAIGGKGIAFELIQPSEVDDREMLLENIVNPRLGRRRCSGIWPPNPRFARSPSRALPLWPRGSLSVPGAHTAPDALP
jgi:hypothetical protein